MGKLFGDLSSEDRCGKMTKGFFTFVMDCGLSESYSLGAFWGKDVFSVKGGAFEFVFSYLLFMTGGHCYIEKYNK